MTTIEGCSGPGVEIALGGRGSIRQCSISDNSGAGVKLHYQKIVVAQQRLGVLRTVSMLRTSSERGAAIPLRQSGPQLLLTPTPRALLLMQQNSISVNNYLGQVQEWLTEVVAVDPPSRGMIVPRSSQAPFGSSAMRSNRIRQGPSGTW